MTNADYEVKPKKKFPWVWVIAGAIMLLFGSCAYGFMGMFKNIGVVQPINDSFIAETLKTKLPPISSGIYSEKSGFTDKDFAPVNALIATLGAPEEIGETGCSANSNASTNELSGHFVNCSGNVTYAISPATLSTRWRKEGEDWKLLYFNLNILDVGAYSELVAEQALAKEKAKKAEGQTP